MRRETQIIRLRYAPQRFWCIAQWGSAPRLL